jgi:hypothetical protein
MPNWCNNHLTISHDDAAMIQKLVDNPTAPLQAVLPMPETLAPDKDTTANWYDWRIENWGTKWDVELEHVATSNEGKTLATSFGSAWSPPIEAYEKLKDMGFKISAFYVETGVGFAGRYEDGDQEFIPSLDFDKENWREGMSDELIDYLEPDYQTWRALTKDYEREQARLKDERDPLDNIEQELWYDTSAELD